MFAGLVVTGGVAVTSGPFAGTSGAAAPAYDNTVTVASVNQSLGLGTSLGQTFAQGFHTGVLTSTATSAYPVTPTGDASATVDALDFQLLATPLVGAPLNLFSIGATTLQSTAAVDGTGGVLSSAGNATITGLTLTGSALGGLVVDGSLFLNPAANTELLNVLGLRIILNEQTGSGDGTSSIGISTNAIHIIFSDFLLGTDLLNGDILVAHSEANIAGFGGSSTPEPATWVQLITGFGLIGGMARRRRLKAA